MGMMEPLRVRHRGGEAEFRPVLGLPVIQNTPVAEFRKKKDFGNVETLIQL
jgi:hypothetical protein